MFASGIFSEGGELSHIPDYRVAHPAGYLDIIAIYCLRVTR
jgi:hypothetical protein